MEQRLQPEARESGMLPRSAAVSEAKGELSAPRGKRRYWTAQRKAALNFYSNTLGMKILQRKAKSLHLDAGGVRLELIAKEVYQGEERLGRPGVHHLSFRVDNIEKKAEELKREGVKFIKDPIDRGGGLRIAFFDGLNNVNLQLYELKE